MNKPTIYGAICGALIALLVVLVVDVVTAPGITPDDSTTWIEPFRYYLYAGIVVIGIVLGVGRARRRDHNQE